MYTHRVEGEREREDGRVPLRILRVARDAGTRDEERCALVVRKTNDRRGTCKRAGIEGYHRGTIRSIS